MIAPLNSTMIAVALPDLREGFGIGRHEVSWLVSAYLIAMAVAMPIGGRIGDQIGRAKAFRLGLLAFLGFSLASAAAPSFELLVLLRTCQALVGAVVIPNGMAMLRSASSQRRFGEANGIVGSIIGISAAVGPVLGGLLLEAGSWRLLFLANVPLIAAALVLQALLRYEDSAERQPLRVDWLAAMSLAGALAALTFLLGSGGGANGALLVVATALLAGLGGFFVLRQRTSAMPVAEWRLFRDRSFAAATGFVLLSNMIMYTALLAIPFFLKEVQGRDDAAVGLVLGSMSIIMTFLAPATGRYSDKQGRRLPSILGGLCMVAAAVLLVAGIGEHVSLGYLAGCLALLGVGIGLGTGPATAAAIEASPQSQSGVASGMVSMMRYFGSIIGAGTLGSVLGDGATPSIEVFRVMFAAVAVTSALTTLGATQIHRFGPDRPAGARTAEQLS
ncbi:MAG: MFS transporter [Dehalococcoidia bacterium]